MKNLLLTLYSKLTWKSFIIPLLAFVAPIKFILILVGVFIVFDTYMGIKKAKKLNKKISSRALSAVISKMLLYQTCVITSYMLEIYLLGDIIALIFPSVPLLLTKLVGLGLIGVELFSISENSKIIYGVNLWGKIKQVFRRAADESLEVGEIVKEIKKNIPK